jgi:hypothetical protein
MAQVRLKTQVWREGDTLPPPQLSHGAPPADLEPDAPRPSPRGLLKIVLAGAFIVGAAALVITGIDTAPCPIWDANLWVGLAAWALAGLHIIIWAWRRNR